MKQREKIAAAYSSGDAAPLDAIVARDGAATFMPPSGGSVSGAQTVAARYDADVKAFAPDSKTQLEVLQAEDGERLAFWTGFQSFDGKIGGHPAKMRLRVTEVFRREGGEWKLIHRHADPADAPAPKKP
jgi:ketosteroid isomerase-like protein